MKPSYSACCALLTLMCFAPASEACTRTGSGPYWEGRVYVLDEQMKVGETCTGVFSRNINRSSENIEITNVSAGKEFIVKTGKNKDGEAFLSYTATQEGHYDIDYYIQAMWPGHGVEGHWQRSRITVIK